ncbi:uncharacterized protein [Battus philenor]|uniref:uncharacterized protein isoform X2 n=1 Tax=Battus philenor TaxID=42288 RepID=UPI0035D06EDF
MCSGDMASPRRYLLLVAVLCVTSLCNAGPLGPLPNVTSMDLGLKEGGCALGDVVYMPGDEFPGESACERCTCARGGVQCARQRCEPRPGCKALHRPDHCCPTYQCECEQEGRVYGNGEKLVDPADPCRVCYCQGGEVVCRRIACFVRDDCTPRRVPGRCCPEYDNCPLRGVTTIPGIATAMPNIPTFEDISASVLPSAVKEPIKQEITIKEITPVSEIPVITDVKIKEILPSPSIDVAEYSSSKSPLIPREVTSEKSQVEHSDDKFEAPEVPSANIQATSDTSSPPVVSKLNEKDQESKSTNDAPPSRISLSTQDSINSNIYSPSVPSVVAAADTPVVTPEVVSVSSSKVPSIDEEDTSLFDHNPAFPPLPDDLSVPGNHEEEILPEQTAESEHAPNGHEVIVASVPATSTEAATAREAGTTPPTLTSETSSGTSDISREMSLDGSTTKSDDGVIVVTTKSRESSMPNLRSVMATETLAALPPQAGTSVELGDGTAAPDSAAAYTTGSPTQSNDDDSDSSDLHFVDSVSSTDDPDSEAESTSKVTEAASDQPIAREQTTSSILKSDAGTDVTARTELSSLPVETSDQNPHDSSENITKDKAAVSTADPLLPDDGDTKLWPTSSEVLAASKNVPAEDDNRSLEIADTTEFAPSPFSSQESSTGGVELIKNSPDSGKSSAIVDPSSGRNNNVLTDLINLVGDVASIGDHNDGSDGERHTLSPTTISDSEELIPVNTGYKSKNKNRNPNSITEVPSKSKAGGKQKGVEIEDDDDDALTDAPPPHDNVEPTTRRALIDSVSDAAPANGTDRKDIEIITQAYVPSISRRPTKVVMDGADEKAEEAPADAQ